MTIVLTPRQGKLMRRIEKRRDQKLTTSEARETIGVKTNSWYHVEPLIRKHGLLTNNEKGVYRLPKKPKKWTVG